jgi:hypothetical protein
VLALESGCMLVGYDSEKDELKDGATDSSREAMTEDVFIVTDSMTHDSTTPDVMDARSDVTTSDSSMDSSQKDAAESGSVLPGDDAATGECQTGRTWCNKNKLVTCNSDAIVVVVEDCTTNSACEVGVCNTSTKSCIRQPASPQTRWCEGDHLMSCKGLGSLVDYDCSQEGDSCNTATCDSLQNACTLVPVDNSTPCYDNGICDAGTCTCGTPGATWCSDATLVTCTDSGIVQVQDCSSLSNDCNNGACVNNNECTATPVKDSRSCGSGGTCNDQGQCVIGTTSCTGGSDCLISCGPEIGPCVLDCGSASTCTATCQAGSTCDVQCASAETCNVACRLGANCNVTCNSGTAENSSSCNVNCVDAESCNTLTCPTNAQCLFSCASSNGNCVVDTCPSSQTCGDGVHSCNGSPCPL